MKEDAATASRLALLKQRIDTLRSDRDRADGAAEHLLKRLKDEWGCESVEDAEAEQSRIEKQLAKAEAKFAKALDEFKAKWDKERS